MEKHKQLLDKEYEQLLTQFSKVIIHIINLLSMMIICIQGRKYQRGITLCGSTHMILEHSFAYLKSPAKK